MLEEITLNGEKYYQHNINNSVGDIFTDWKDIEIEEKKLLRQLERNQ